MVTVRVGVPVGERQLNGVCQEPRKSLCDSVVCPKKKLSESEAKICRQDPS